MIAAEKLVKLVDQSPNGTRYRQPHVLHVVYWMFLKNLKGDHDYFTVAKI